MNLINGSFFLRLTVWLAYDFHRLVYGDRGRFFLRFLHNSCIRLHNGEAIGVLDSVVYALLLCGGLFHGGMVRRRPLALQRVVPS